MHFLNNTHGCVGQLVLCAISSERAHARLMGYVYIDNVTSLTVPKQHGGLIEAPGQCWVLGILRKAHVIGRNIPAHLVI